MRYYFSEADDSAILNWKKEAREYYVRMYISDSGSIAGKRDQQKASVRTKDKRKGSHAFLGDICRNLWFRCAVYDLGGLYSGMAAQCIF